MVKQTKAEGVKLIKLLGKEIKRGKREAEGKGEGKGKWKGEKVRERGNKESVESKSKGKGRGRKEIKSSPPISILILSPPTNPSQPFGNPLYTNLTRQKISLGEGEEIKLAGRI